VPSHFPLPVSHCSLILSILSIDVGYTLAAGFVSLFPSPSAPVSTPPGDDSLLITMSPPPEPFPRGSTPHIITVYE
jgi:hypothetical protein